MTTSKDNSNQPGDDWGDDMLPVWSSDREIDPAWIQRRIPEFKTVIRCTVEDISNLGRKGETPKDGATLRLTIVSAGNDENTTNTENYVVKQVPSSGVPLSKQLGLAREACFFNELAPRVNKSFDSTTNSSFLPKVSYAHGNVATGAKFIIMQDLSDGYIDSGILFGPGNPNNWSRDLPAKIAQAYPVPLTEPSAFEVANETFLAIAQVHATFWNDRSLLTDDHEWLRGSSWIKGNQKESWEASQGLIQNTWSNLGPAVNDRIQWDPLVKSIVTKALENISWDAQLARMNPNKNFTLVHGDFWPGNIMVSTKDTKDLKLLDWEMVGLGSGPQDLGQYILSNMSPQDRRECEDKLIRNYHDRLLHYGVQISWEECWREYMIGGLERWLWFLVYFCGQEGPLLSWAQFFHDQIKEFVHDHNIKPEDVTQPRP